MFRIEFTSHYFVITKTKTRSVRNEEIFSRIYEIFSRNFDISFLIITRKSIVNLNSKLFLLVFYKNFQRFENALFLCPTRRNKTVSPKVKTSQCRLFFSLSVCVTVLGFGLQEFQNTKQKSLKKK